MDAYLRMAVRDRRLACLKVAEEKRLQAASVDKDFWVCWTLREIFSLPDIGSRITFKGGTSLSKAWGLIERFSEDIDLVVDKDALGFAGEASPDQAPSNKQRRRRNIATLGVETTRKWRNRCSMVSGPISTRYCAL